MWGTGSRSDTQLRRPRFLSLLVLTPFEHIQQHSGCVVTAGSSGSRAELRLSKATVFQLFKILGLHEA